MLPLSKPESQLNEKYGLEQGVVEINSLGLSTKYHTTIDLPGDVQKTCAKINILPFDTQYHSEKIINYLVLISRYCLIAVLSQPGEKYVSSSTSSSVSCVWVCINTSSSLLSSTSLCGGIVKAPFLPVELQLSSSFLMRSQLIVATGVIAMRHSNEFH